MCAAGPRSEGDLPCPVPPRPQMAPMCWQCRSHQRYNGRMSRSFRCLGSAAACLCCGLSLLPSLCRQQLLAPVLSGLSPFHLMCFGLLSEFWHSLCFLFLEKEALATAACPAPAPGLSALPPAPAPHLVLPAGVQTAGEQSVAPGSSSDVAWRVRQEMRIDGSPTECSTTALSCGLFPALAQEMCLRGCVGLWGLNCSKLWCPGREQWHFAGHKASAESKQSK